MDSEEDHAAVLAEGLTPTQTVGDCDAFNWRRSPPTLKTKTARMSCTLSSNSAIPPRPTPNLSPKGYTISAPAGVAIHAYCQVLRIDRSRFKTLKDLTLAHWQQIAQLIDLIAAADIYKRADLVDNFRQQIRDAIATSLHVRRLRPDAKISTY